MNWQQGDIPKKKLLGKLKGLHILSSWSLQRECGGWLLEEVISVALCFTATESWEEKEFAIQLLACGNVVVVSEMLCSTAIRLGHSAGNGMPRRVCVCVCK